MRSLAARSLALLVLAAALRGQTFIVDANNGPGTHFLDIPPAVAAVPSGAALRVRAGTYSAFTVANKSLAILGDASSTVQVRGFTIGPLAPVHRVVVRDVRITTFSAVRVAGAQGHVQLDTIQFAPSPGVNVAWFTVQGSTDVHLRSIVPEAGAETDLDIDGSCVEIAGCRLAGRAQPVAGSTGFPAVRARNSRLVVSGTTLGGGRGGSDFANLFGEGGAGLELVDSTADLGPGNAFTGGEGGIDPTGLGGCYQIMRSGGPGLRLVQSTARGMGTTLQGGRGPCLVCFTGPCTVFGPPLLADGSSSFATPPGIAPSARLVGVPMLNSFVDVVLSAGPNEVALLAFGFTPACVSWPWLIDFAGILVLPEIVFGPFVTNAAGAASYRLPLPAGFVTDRVVWAQYFTFPGLVLPGMGSNSIAFAVKS